MSLIAPLYEGSTDDEATRQRALEILSQANFGLDGYFFVYDQQGKNLMHPRQSELVGKQLITLTDKNGLPVIQALLKSARRAMDTSCTTGRSLLPGRLPGNCHMS